MGIDNLKSSLTGPIERTGMSTALDGNIKKQVREFYDQVGWHEVSEGCYQNARYEDLRPVSREYIHKCHLRVDRHLKKGGIYLLDLGSGPIQYPVYLEYSRGYQSRVCADISIVALKEARQRIGDRTNGGHGLFVVADAVNLPFKTNTFDGIVTLHTLHHLPKDEHIQAYFELHRVLEPNSTAVVVNGWGSSLFGNVIASLTHWQKNLKRFVRYLLREDVHLNEVQDRVFLPICKEPKGTYVSKMSAHGLRHEIGDRMKFKILVWRSVSVKFLRVFIHPHLGGRWFLRLLYILEEWFPAFFGHYGQYPLIVVHKV